MGESAPVISTFTASDGYRFYVRRWLPSGRPRARLVLLHGIRSHGGWYGRSSARFAAEGIEVAFLDRRGSGWNTPHRGDCPGFRRLIDDVAEFLIAERSERPWLPTFLGGISWGGKLAVAMPYRRPGLLDGLILFCPGLKPQVTPPFGTRLRIALSRALRPTRTFPIPLNEADLFTGSPEWQSWVDHDRYGLRQATSRFLSASVMLDIYLRRAARRMTLPSLLLLAGHDRIVDNARTRAFVASFPTRQNHVIDYPEAHHTLEFEADDHPFVDDVLRWIGRRINSPR